MPSQTLKLRVKTEGRDGKNYWDTCGVLFVNANDQGEITSITVRHNMFPGVEMAAFPRRDSDGAGNDETEQIAEEG